VPATLQSPLGPSSTPLPSIDLPAFSGPSRTFTFDRESSYHVHDYTKSSQFVLYDDGAFVLQYVGVGEYRGRYEGTNGALTFEWEGSNTAGPWGATGVLIGDSLTVHYSEIMQLTDFEDAVYAAR
jgi:hypothetical protein